MAKRTKKKTLQVTQIKSVIGQKGTHKKTIEALGLKKLNHTVTHNDTPQIRGMLQKVVHLVSVEEV